MLVSSAVGAVAFAAGIGVAVATAGAGLPVLAIAAGAATSLDFLLLNPVADAAICHGCTAVDERR
jgi:hypothetical protein